MGTEYGKDWRIFVGDGGGPETFSPIGGEGSFDWKRSSDKIDLSSKDDGQYKSGSFGQQEITISVNGNAKLPDTGLEGAFDIAKASPPELNIKIMKGATVKFACLMGIGNFSTTHHKDGPVTYSFDLSNVGAPSVDDLGA